MEEKNKIKTDLRMAECFIGKAKLCLFDYYEDYADIQKLMSDLESVRVTTERLLSKFIKGKLK